MKSTSHCFDLIRVPINGLQTWEVGNPQHIYSACHLKDAAIFPLSRVIISKANEQLITELVLIISVFDFTRTGIELSTFRVVNLHLFR